MRGDTKKSVLVVAEWINLNGGVTRTLLELLKRIDPERYDVTLYVMRPKESDLSALPPHVTVIENDFDLPYLGARAVLQRFLDRRQFLSAATYLGALLAWKTERVRANYVGFFVKRHPPLTQRYDIAASYAMLDTYSNQFVAERVDAERKVMWGHTDTALYTGRNLDGLDHVFHRYDAINCVSRDVEQSMLRWAPDLGSRLRVRYNLMDEDEIRRLAKEESAPVVARRGAPIRLTTVGRVSSEKGTDLLLEAAAMLKAAGYDFAWTVVGPDHDPDFAAKVKTQWRDAGLEGLVEFVGAQRNPYPFIARCDIYVQPSRVEGYCMSTVEAKILGRPVVRTDVSGAREQFEHGVNGSVVPATAKGLFEEIKRLVDRPAVRRGYEERLAAEAVGAATDVASFFE